MLPMIRRAADDSLMVTELYISHLCTEKNTSHVFTEIIRPSHKNIDYNCCLAYRSVQHIFIPYDTIIRLFKPRLAARCRIQAQNSVCNKVCAGYQLNYYLIIYKYYNMYLAESKVETYIHVNIQCNIFDVRLSFNLLKVITVLLKCILENCLW